MVKYYIIALVLFSLGNSLAIAQEDKNVDKIKKKYQLTKNKISNSESFTRRVSNTLSKINKQMRKIRRKRNRLNSKVQGVSIQIDELNIKITDLEKNIKSRKHQISKQFRALYKLSNLNQLMYILNSNSIHEFEQNTKYLKMYSEADYDLILEYAHNISDLKSSKIKLSDSIKELKIASTALKVQNKSLDKQIKSKKVLLSHLKKQRLKYFEQLSKIKNSKEKLALSSKISHLDDIFGTDFLGKRGSLSMPVAGIKIEKFGVSVDKKYKNKTKNNGIFIESQKNRFVKSVHPGEVSYVGSIRGLGKVVIIDHGDHYYTVYGNNKNVFVYKGEKIKQSQNVGDVGYSPYHNAFGAYFEIRYFTEPIDPSKWLAGANNSYSQL